MSHRALTEDQVKEFKEIGLTDDMIKRMDNKVSMVIVHTIHVDDSSLSCYAKYGALHTF